jgi:hypothetical protein
MQDLMSQYSFEFCRLQGIDECRIVDDALPIRRHRRYGARNKLQPKTERPKEGLSQEVVSVLE